MLVAAGSGMSPIWSILHDHLASGEQRPVYFFYGARTQSDLFHLDRIAAGRRAIPRSPSSPSCRMPPTMRAWQGERGFVHERVGAKLKELALDGVRATSTPAARRR